ncbi:MAG: FMN-binding protein [Pleomorphochaeta sp.]
MTFLYSIIFSIIYIAIFYKSIKKKKNIHYIAISILSIATIIFNSFQFENIIISNILRVVNRGFISLALFTIVMFIGALNKNSKIYKKLIPIRTQLSIIASIITIPHIFTLYQKCIFDILDLKVTGIITLIIFIFFVILFITSFKYFKIKLKGKNWKKVQRLAYPFFFLTFLHVFSVTALHISRAGTSAIIDLSIYSFVFLLYFILRLNLARKKSNKKYYLFIQIIVIIFFIIMPIKAIKQSNQMQLSNEAIVFDENTSSLNTQTREQSQIRTNQEDDTESSNNEILLESNDNIIEETKDIEIESESENSIEESKLVSENKIYNDGVYVDMARGYRDYISMAVTIENDIITDLEVDYNRDDARFFDMAYDTIVEEILEKQSTDVDAVSRATYSSNGIINAIKNALEQAKIK